MTNTSLRLAVPILSMLAPSAFLGGCGEELDLEPDEDPAFRIAEEIPSVVERAFVLYGANPTATLRSYASVTTRSNDSSEWPGARCSGTMIGPNVMLSAGHCHGDEKSATFRGYVRNDMQQTELYQCDYLVQAWPEMDVALHWCFPNNGVNPGDRWGYVDLDVAIDGDGQLLEGMSRDRLTEGLGLYSVWWNPLQDIGGDHHLYSAGEIVDNTDAAHWGNPGGQLCTQSDDDALGILTDVWGVGGASGSSQLSSARHRIAVGPLSTVGLSGGDRRASAIVDCLRRAQIVGPWSEPSCPQNDGFEAQLNAWALSDLWSQGIKFDENADFGKYEDVLDANGDGIFDIQHDLEMSAGEGQRDAYDLGFTSHRRNALWTRHNGIQLYPTHNYAHAELSAANNANWRMALSHSRLNLDPAERYRVQYSAWTNEASSVRACLSGCETHQIDAYNSTAFVDEFNGGSELALWLAGGVRTQLRDISIIREGATIDFDSHDQRTLWHSPNLFGTTTAFMTPNGVNSQTEMDWAGIVRESSFADYSLGSDRLAIPRGAVRVCFAHRRHSGTGTGTVRLQNTSGSEVPFSTNTSWRTTCTPRIEVTRDGGRLEFSANGSSSLVYAVDDVVIEHWPTSVPEGAVALVGLDDDACMEARGSTPGSPVELRPCNGSAAQRWEVGANGEIHGAKGLCLDVSGGHSWHPHSMRLEICDGTAAQQFTQTRDEQHLHAHNNFCVEVQGVVSSDGTPGPLYQCSGPAAPSWPGL